MAKSSQAPRGTYALVCPLGRFDRTEIDIRALTARINQSPEPGERANLARELQAETTRLIECNAFNSESANCRLCREFSSLRRQTAELMLKVAVTAAAAAEHLP